MAVNLNSSSSQQVVIVCMFIASMSCRLNRTSPAAIAGGYSTWTTPYSYNVIREMQLAIGLLRNGSCVRGGTLEELIRCEPGQIRLPFDQQKDRCLELGLACPDVSFNFTMQPLPYQLILGLVTRQCCRHGPAGIFTK